ncbi:MAG: hypothetical protein M3P93_01420 [Actinomycetota bacterium]|nr:hypothetical protein [Actinomycetota bacterium]
MQLDRRQKAYFGLRGLAAAGVPASVLLMPPGLPAAALCVGCGLLAVLTCIGVNAGGPGERAGARAQERKLARVRAPQGDWPPYPESARTVDGEVVR